MNDDTRADANRARYVVRAVAQFSRGCTNAGPDFVGVQGMSSDPADCPECVASFLSAVRRAMDDRSFTVSRKS